jgi:hypothetical protein
VKVRKTRIKRALALWLVMFLLTFFLVARPTGFRLGYWFYGLIWGLGTSVVHYAFRRFFEEEIEV